MFLELSAVAVALTSSALVLKGFSAVSSIHVRFDRLEQKMLITGEVVEKIEKELIRRNYL